MKVRLASRIVRTTARWWTECRSHNIRQGGHRLQSDCSSASSAPGESLPRRIASPFIARVPAPDIAVTGLQDFPTAPGRSPHPSAETARRAGGFRSDPNARRAFNFAFSGDNVSAPPRSCSPHAGPLRLPARHQRVVTLLDRLPAAAPRRPPPDGAPGPHRSISPLGVEAALVEVNRLRPAGPARLQIGSMLFHWSYTRGILAPLPAQTAGASPAGYHSPTDKTPRRHGYLFARARQCVIPFAGGVRFRRWRVQSAVELRRTGGPTSAG